MTGLIHVATIVTSRGNKGEVTAVCPSGEPARLLGVDCLWMEEEGSPQARPLQKTWLHKGRLVLHFRGVDSIGDAKGLVGRRLFLQEESLPELPADSFYTFALQGASVQDLKGRELGRVVDTERAPAQDLLVVQRSDGSRALVPMSASIIRNVDVEAGVIHVDAPEGLLEGEPEIAAVADGTETAS